MYNPLRLEGCVVDKLQEWLARLESGSSSEEPEEIANMDPADYATILEENEYR